MYIGKVRVWSWILPGIWIALIFGISSIPAAPLINAYTQLENVILRFLLSDPVSHIVMFGVLGFLLGRSFRNSFPLMGKRNLILWAFLVTFLLSFLNEVYQQLVIPGRAFEIVDLIWNFVGIGAAISCLSIIFPKTMRKSHSIQ
ncbi:VanZ family protein [Patescibacteria group bacterium]|nr:VanZ family protein [Patescibacteria group bacterium]